MITTTKRRRESSMPWLLLYCIPGLVQLREPEDYHEEEEGEQHTMAAAVLYTWAGRAEGTI